MKNKTMWLSTALCMVPILFGVSIYDQLPEMVPTHFDLLGNPNGWSSRPMAVFGIPLLLAAMNLLCHWLTGRDEKTRQASPKALLSVVYWIIPVIGLFLIPMSLFEGMGIRMPIPFFSCTLIGVLFVIIGNYLPKCKPNRYMGIKLPWTFASEENWYKTHRFGGKVWVAAGFIIILAELLRIWWLVFAVLMAAVILPCGYSYWEWKKENK